jgi:hypothetical protein
MEAAIQIDFGRSEQIHGKLRDPDVCKLLGCQIVWDATEFRLD